MKVAVTGATGTIGRAVVAALRDRGDDVAILTRSLERGWEVFGRDAEVHDWRDPKRWMAPTEAFKDCDGVIHLLGEPIAQRWDDEVKREIRDSRVLGTRNLVDALREAGPRMRTLVSQSAVGYYGPQGDERVDESWPPGDDFLARVVVDWEAEAMRADEELGLRVVTSRTGIVLSEKGGALEKMLPFFKLGIGGPVAGGRQYMSWIHVEDVARAMLFCLDTEAAGGPVNFTAPEPVTNKELSKALGRVLHRPAILPVPGLAVGLLYGQMSEIVTTGQRAIPKRLQELGHEFRHADLDEALRSALA